MTSDKTIPPGGEGEIKVTFNPKGRPGVAHKTISVSTNDPSSPQIPLKLVANVVGALIVEPPNLSLGDLDFGAGGSAEIAVSLRADVQGTIKEARSGSTKLAIERLPRPDAKGRTIFRIDIDKTAPIGPLRDVVTIITDAEGAATARVVVNANVVGDVDYQPRSLSLNQPGGKVLFTRRPGKPPLKILGVDSSTPDATLKLTEITPGEQYQLDVTIAADKKRVRGKITVKLANRHEPEIVVPLSYATPAEPIQGGAKSVRRNVEKPGPVGKTGNVIAPGPGPAPAVR